MRADVRDRPPARLMSPSCRRIPASMASLPAAARHAGECPASTASLAAAVGWISSCVTHRFLSHTTSTAFPTNRSKKKGILAHDRLVASRWPNGPVCPHCGSLDAALLGGTKHRDGLYYCPSCRSQFTVLTGSVDGAQPRQPAQGGATAANSTLTEYRDRDFDEVLSSLSTFIAQARSFSVDILGHVIAGAVTARMQSLSLPELQKVSETLRARSGDTNPKSPFELLPERQSLPD